MYARLSTFPVDSVGGMAMMMSCSLKVNGRNRLSGRHNGDWTMNSRLTFNPFTQSGYPAVRRHGLYFHVAYRLRAVWRWIAAA